MDKEIAELLIKDLKEKLILEQSEHHDEKILGFVEEEFTERYLKGMGSSFELYIKFKNNKIKTLSDEEKKIFDSIKFSRKFIYDLVEMFAYMSGSKIIDYWDTTALSIKQTYIDSKEKLEHLVIKTYGSQDIQITKMYRRNISQSSKKMKELPNKNELLTYKNIVDEVGGTNAIISMYGEQITYDKHVKNK